MSRLPTIKLFKNHERKCWMVQYVDDKLTLAALGTDIVASHYGLEIGIREIVDIIHKEHPNCNIIASNK